MGDFVEDTALETIGERRYRLQLAKDWRTWGPAGGYVAATALRAAGEATDLPRPASFACQFLSAARFEAVEIEVESLRAGRRTEALRVRMTQEGDPVLEAQVWAVAENEGLEHDYTRPPEVPPVEACKDVRELEPERKQLGLFQNFDRRPIGRKPGDELEVREPVMRNWFRFQPRPTAEDRFVDAGRAVILIDSFSWPSTWPAHPSDGPSPWIAPNLDLYVRFHRDARPYEWLLGDSSAELAADGLIGTQGAVWSPDGGLIAEGSSQLFCRPRPERFR